MDAREKTLRELPVVILDAQATGATPNHGVLLEIAHGVTTARESAPREVAARWIQLPPQARVSRVVRELTGYTDADAAQAMAPGEAWRELVASADRARGEALGPAPAVIHFAQFEVPFLRDLHARFGVDDEPFPLQIVCAHAIARRLYPDLPRSNIRALAGFLGHTTPIERRAHGHVVATAHVWSSLVDRLEAQRIVAWGEVVEFLASSPSRRGRRTFPMDKAIRAGLPDAPGVYRFKRSNGDVLYVGKAASLKKRIAGHFAAAARAPARSQEMLTQALDVDFTVTDTPLEAALLEVDQIKAMDPPYNVHLRDRRAWFTTRALDASSELRDAEHPLGPLPSPGATLGLGAVLLHRRTGDVSAVTRARAVQVPIAFAPDAPTFLEGVASFARRHALGPARGERDPALARLGFRLSVSQQEEPEPQAESPRVWDAARVARHLERSVASGVRLLARARWLTILSDALVEVEDGAHRWLDIRAGQVVARKERPHRPAADVLPWAARQGAFSGAQYDRLRVLNTELRRVASEGGLVRVRVGRLDKSLVVEGTRLVALLART
jgi:DNA polymerase III subunit epsilon